jgi:hypothetical protein
VHATLNLSLHGDTLQHDSSGTGGTGASEGNSDTAGKGGSGGNGGAVLADATATINDTTFVDDRSGSGGAGGDNTSTVHPGNGGQGGAGGVGGSVQLASASTSLIHVTIVGGGVGAGGAGGSSVGATGGSGGSSGTAGGVAGPATIIASVIVASGAGQCAGTTDGGDNLSFPDHSCGGKHIAPKLAALANYGGPTQTFLPLPGSPVLDAVPTGGPGCSGSGQDQRGVPRPQGPACDIGAVEAADPALTASRHSVVFGPVRAGKAKTATIAIRTTFDPLRVTAALRGAHASSFAITANGCSGRLLRPHTSCQISVRFKAAGRAGARTATLHISHTTPGPALNVTLTARVQARKG